MTDTPTRPRVRRDPAWLYYAVAVVVLAVVGILDLVGLFDSLGP
jgi:hypothetical protein